MHPARQHCSRGVYEHALYFANVETVSHSAPKMLFMCKGGWRLDENHIYVDGATMKMYQYVEVVQQRHAIHPMEMEGMQRQRHCTTAAIETHSHEGAPHGGRKGGMGEGRKARIVRGANPCLIGKSNANNQKTICDRLRHICKPMSHLKLCATRLCLQCV